ncbi:MAG: hypothetical protein VW338_09220 [Rhodospirillaceae bacterium]
MCLSKPSVPEAPPPPPPPPKPPKQVDAAVKKARADEKNKAALAQGRDGTIATGPQGLSLTPANTTRKQVLGA